MQLTFPEATGASGQVPPIYCGAAGTGCQGEAQLAT
jgi:hypothetical protein